MCSLYKLSANLRHLLPDAVGPIVGWHGPEAVDLPRIRPTNIAPIIVARDDGLHVLQGRWGVPPLPSSGSKTPIINARNLDSPFWRPHLGQRALIPTTGFCEWDAAKQPWWFEKDGGGVFAFAGLYTHLPGEPLPRFVIVTTAAEPPVVDVHPKAMPIGLLGRIDCQIWLQSQKFSKSGAYFLAENTEYQQRDLFAD